MSRLEDPRKRVVLTGATRGLGRALTSELAMRGHTVFGCGRTLAEVERLRAEYPAPHEFEVVDVANDDEVAAWAGRFLAAGAPDLLLNNAALINRNARLWEVPADEFDRLIDVNVKGVANLIRHVAPAMIARGRGVIVNFSSGWGRSVASEVAPYCASKWAVEGMTRALARELPPGLAAVTLNPGVIDTDMLRTCYGDQAAQFPGPEEWAQTAVEFLLQVGPKDNGKPLTAP